MKVDDRGSYAPLLEALSKLKSAIKPHKMPSGRLRRRAKLLKSILGVVAERAEAHAISKNPGLAGVLYTEISGHAGLPIFRRFDAALAAAAAGGASASSSDSSAAVFNVGQQRSAPRTGFSRASAPGRLKDLSTVTCFGCHKTGHYRNQCPNARPNKANDKA